MSIETAPGTVLFGIDDRQVQVSQEAYSIFMARERDMRQQLADVSKERDVEAARHNDVLLCFGMMRDERDALQLRLNASEARNSELVAALEIVENTLPHIPTVNYSIAGLLFTVQQCLSGPSEPIAQSAPATDEQGAK